MPPKKPEPLTLKNTKQQMLDAYNELLKKLEEKRESELKPEQKVAEQKVERAVKTADALSLDGVAESISQIKSEMNKLLTALVDKLENELAKYDQVKQAIEAQEKELEETFSGLEKLFFPVFWENSRVRRLGVRSRRDSRQCCLSQRRQSVYYTLSSVSNHRNLLIAVSVASYLLLS